MRYAIIENGIVANVIELDPKDEAAYEEASGANLIASDVAAIGYLWDGEEFEAPPPPAPEPEPVPEIISDRQFFQALASDPYGLITEEEALAAVMTGAIPAAMEGFIAQLPQADQFAARMVLCGATAFRRTNIYVEMFGMGMGWAANQIDDLWRFAGGL